MWLKYFFSPNARSFVLEYLENQTFLNKNLCYKKKHFIKKKSQDTFVVFYDLFKFGTLRMAWNLTYWNGLDSR